jgi:hypothetical protein
MKISESLEGENSSLRKTFDEAVREELIQEIADCFSGAGIHYHAGKLRTILSRTISKADLIQRVSFLRQWLNEDRITDPKRMVTNEEILKFISGE